MPEITTSNLDYIRKCPVNISDAEKDNQTAIEYYKQVCD